MFKRQLGCSFCKKRETEVAKLVAGPRVYICGPRLYICDGCVALASRIMDSNANDDSRPPRAKSSVWRRIVARAWQFLRGSHARCISSMAVSGSRAIAS